MLYYDKIEISRKTDLSKCNNGKECMIWFYWFFNHGFKFQDPTCNGCYDLKMLSVNISKIAIIAIKYVENKEVFYFFYFSTYKIVEKCNENSRNVKTCS